MQQASQAINELYQSKLADNTRENIEIDFIQFAKQLQTGFSHRVLDLQKLKFGGSVLSRIPRTLRLVPNIQRLKFYGNLIRDIGLQKIYQVLQTNPQVTHLDIGSNDLSDDSIVTMLDILRNTTLYSLQLGSFDNNFQTNRFTREGLESMIDVLSAKNIIQCLGIGGIGSVKQKKTHKSKNFSKYIAKLLSSCDKLMTLDISRCSLIDSDQSILASGFSENKSLKHLDLHENYFPSGTRLIDGIAHLNHLVYLNLSNCSLNENACRSLANRLMSGWGLIYLNLSHNINIGNSGISYLLSALPNNIYLIHLNISETGCDESVVPQLHEVFQYNSILQELDLSQNALGDTVSDAFSRLTLNRLSLASCRISDVGAVTICRYLISNHTLKRFSLKDNFLTKGIGYELVNILQGNDSLTFVDLTSTQIDKFALEAVQTICIRNKTTVHTNMLDRLRKEYIHLSIQDSKIPGVSHHLEELKDQHNQLDDEIENLNFQIESVEASSSITISMVKKEIDEFEKAIATQEEQIVELQGKIEEMNQSNELVLKQYQDTIKKDQSDFDKIEVEAEKIEKATIQFNKESLELQKKLNDDIARLDEMLGEVTRISRNKKRLREYEIPVYPYEEEEAAEAAAREEEMKAAERAARRKMMEDDPYGFYALEEEEDNNDDNKKKKRKKTKRSKSPSKKGDKSAKKSKKRKK